MRGNASLHVPPELAPLAVVSIPLFAKLVLAGLAMFAIALRWRRFDGTTLRAPAIWTLLSLGCFAGIELLISLTALSDTVSPALRYVASASTFCPLMALLGAKRPQDVGWQWIVLTLWIVLILPVGETLLLWQGGTLDIGPFRKWLLVILMLVALGNYGLTRFGFASLLAVSGQALLLQPNLPFGITWQPGQLFGMALLCAAMWLAFLQTRPRNDEGNWNTVWLDFRNAFGLVWSLRVMERLNATSRLRRWETELGWFGFDRLTAMDGKDAEVERAVWTVLRRFVSPEWIQKRLGENTQAAFDD